MKLSILIPTIPDRSVKFNELKAEIEKQASDCYKLHDVLGKVEVIHDDSDRYNKSGITVGAKRNGLVQRATGEYLCFLDDDDTVSPDYVETLLRLCYENVDVCCFRALFKCDTYWSVIDLSLLHVSNEQATPERIVRRMPWHICPVKSSIAKQFTFPDINNAEDWAWFSQLLPELKTQSKTDKIIYQYTHSSTGSAVDNP